jgi:hypothetical protein
VDCIIIEITLEGSIKGTVPGQTTRFNVGGRDSEIPMSYLVLHGWASVLEDYHSHSTAITKAVGTVQLMDNLPMANSTDFSLEVFTAMVNPVAFAANLTHLRPHQLVQHQMVCSRYMCHYRVITGK